MEIKYDKCDVLHGYREKHVSVNYFHAIYLIQNSNNTLFAK